MPATVQTHIDDMIASGPDLLRLLVLPVFAWAAYRDFNTRRLPNRLWPPVIGLGILALAWDVWLRYPLGGFPDRLFLIQVGISVLFVAPLGYIFWRLGGFGGADAKALISLAFVYPTYPVYSFSVAWLPTIPVVASNVGVFSLTILTNTVLLGLAYPVALALGNLIAGRRSPVMFLARPVRVESLPSRHGRLFETRSGYTGRGLDLDALRMYLRWRGVTLAALRGNPEDFRDPTRLGVTFHPTDGAVDPAPEDIDDTEAAASEDTDSEDTDSEVTESKVTDSKVTDSKNNDFEYPVVEYPATNHSDTDYSDTEHIGDDDESGGVNDGVSESSTEPANTEPSNQSTGHGSTDDPWAAEIFREEVGSAYGTTPDMLREGLETVVARDRVWVSPGLPFVVPMFVGLIAAVTYGDLLFAFLRLLGFV